MPSPASPPTARPIRVIVVDDSSVVRKALSNVLTAAGGIEVVGAAPDPYVAREMIVALKPDVITLDIEMPRMDGLTFLRKLMAAMPIPTIVISSVAPRGCELALACLEAGAFEVIAKPSAAYSIDHLGQELVDLVRAASRSRPQVIKPAAAPRPGGPIVKAPTPSASLIQTTSKIICIGASTGGTEAIRSVLEKLPTNSPGVAMVQHMPAGFTRSFAERLDSLCQLHVKEASDGDAIVAGTALLAPGNRQMAIRRDGARYIVSVFDGPRVNRHCPSVNVLFESAARHAGGNAMGVLLTGMGDDGASGLLAMRNARAVTLAQDEATSIVYGMPREAARLHAAQIISPLAEVPAHIGSFAGGRLQAAA
jgi:two-component system chemotaxis response regulator CheB